MNNSFSRRALAAYAVEQLTKGTSAKNLARHLAAAMIASGKDKDYELLLSDIAEELESRKLLTQATITSANALTNSLKKQLERFIKETTKSDKILISEVINKEVLGGFRIDTARVSFDKTVAHELAEIKGGI